MTTTATQLHHLKLLASLRRVNKALAAWDELDAQELMPNSLRPWIDVPRLEREDLKGLQAQLIDALEMLNERFARG